MSAEPANAEAGPLLPKWIDGAVFHDLLKEHVAGYKQIRNFKARPALTAGENYATIMLRVEIDVDLESGDTKSLTYMMKVPIQSGIMTEMSKEFNIFEVENTMYLELVPELESMYREVGLEVQFGPQCYKLPISEDAVLLEDLRPRGFKNANRLEGLDLEHTKCVLKKLAQWHAASATRVQTKGVYAPIFTVGFYTDLHRPIVDQMHESTWKAFEKCMKFYEGHESYVKSVENLQKKVVDELYKMGNPNPEEFNVLNHGDCWTNNIMFQYDEQGNVKETYFVDYQISKYGTPAQDLLYFILSSPKLELKLKQFDYLIKYYHDNLSECLTLLKYPKKIPTLKDIHIDLYKYGVWGYWTVTSVMGALLLEPNENASIDNFLSDSDAGNSFKKLMFSNARYKKHIEAILPWLHHRGALD